MKLYFARHGESEANVQGVISNRGYQHPLTQKGRQQAHALVDALRDVPLTHIYTSPLQRALETAQIVAGARGLRYEISDALREYDCGVLEGQRDPVSWAIHEQTWRAWLVDDRPETCPEGGESFVDIQRRFVPFIDSLVAQYAGTTAEILLVGHGGTYRAMLPLVLRNIDRPFAVAQAIANTAYIVAAWQDKALVCTSWCGVTPGFADKPK